MPDNQDNNSMDNILMDDINELFDDDTIETPNEYKFLARAQGAPTFNRYFEGKDSGTGAC